MKISDKAKRGLEWLGIKVTGSRWAWTAAIGTAVFWAGVAHSPPSNPLPFPNPGTPPVELQGTANARAPWTLVRALLNKLPAATSNQHKAPCELDMEREINGACWIPLDLSPCPKGKAWIHEGDGKCYARSMKFPKTPNAGDLVGPGGVAAPE